MRERLLSEVVELMQPAPVEMFGDDVVVGPDVVTDNRAASPGALFVAIPGERVDGHDYAPAAVAAGAAATANQRSEPVPPQARPPSSAPTPPTHLSPTCWPRTRSPR